MYNETFLRVGELIAKLQQYDPSLPVMVTRDGKGHQYPITKEEISIQSGIPYIPDCVFNAFYEYDDDDNLLPHCPTHYLNLGYF